jgi:SAM-dependent methyltransferase
MKNLLRFLFYCIYYPVSRVFLGLERFVSWKENRHLIDNTPKGVFRGLAFESYTNWIWHEGFFSALFSFYCNRTDLNVFDFGCGMGRIAPVSEPFTRDGGRYLGVDVDIRVIQECKSTYQNMRYCEFYHSKDQNAFYNNPAAGCGGGVTADWPVSNGSQNLVISISVFTHLQEAAARFYMAKIHEILAKDGIAIISFHVIRGQAGSKSTFNFNIPLTSGWFTINAECPEHAIAVNRDVITDLIKNRFEILQWLEGSSTGGKSSFFQDLLILKKV